MKTLIKITKQILNLIYWTVAILFPVTANFIFDRDDVNVDYGDEYL